MRFQRGLNGRFRVERFQVRAAKETKTGEVDDACCCIGSVSLRELENVVGNSWCDPRCGDDCQGRMVTSNTSRLETGL